MKILRAFHSRHAKRQNAPYGLGTAQEIYNLFVAPLFKSMIQQIEEPEIEVLIDGVFHYNSRKLKLFRAKRNFWLPGRYALNPNRQIEGFKKTKIKEGSLLIVRIDRGMPDRVDVEHEGDSDAFYVLTNAQWSSIKENLRGVDEDGDVFRSR